MPFITQGKTNLTYILIVVVLAVTVGGGILSYQYLYSPKDETGPQEFPYQTSAKKMVNIKVTNSITNQPITGAKITIESYHNCSPAQVVGNECVPELWNLETNVNGEVIFDKLGAPLNIQVTAEKKGFQTITEQVIDDEFIIEESSAELLLSLLPKEDTKDETADWKNFINAKFGFEFRYPQSWGIVEEVSPQIPYQEPAIFDMVVMPINHLLNKAIHVSILNMTFNKTDSDIKKLLTGKNQLTNLQNFNSVNLKGEKYKIVSSEVVSYGYIFELGDKVILIAFESYINNPERFFDNDLLVEMDNFAHTFSVTNH